MDTYVKTTSSLIEEIADNLNDMVGLVQYGILELWLFVVDGWLMTVSKVQMSKKILR